mgnify:CR=1 FL=1
MKNKLRQYAKELRNTLSIQDLSVKIKNNLFSMPEFKSSKNILAYYSMGSEVCTYDYFDDYSKNWFLPKIDGENLLVCPYNGCKLSQNRYKILEPENQNISDESIIDMVIIPAVCADKNGYRLGYGKGYYDRFIKRLTHKPLKVILVYSKLFFDNVYPDSFDEKCDFIVTDKEIYKV